MAGRKGKGRWVEPAKTALIVLLTCSAVFLAAKTNAYHTLAADLSDRFSTLFHHGTAPGEGGSAAADRPLMASRPVAAAVCPDGDAGRYAAQYDSAAVSRLAEEHSALLGEALAAAETPQSVSTAAWRTALQRPGLYFQFPTPVPLSALYAWLGEGVDNSALALSTALRVVLCRGSGDAVDLYYQAGRSETFYRCATNLSYREHLAPQLVGYGANGALFAFEFSDGAYDRLAPYTLLCDSPAPPVYQASMPLSLTDGTDLDALQRQLGFHPQISAVINLPDVVSVREDEDSLRVSSAGMVSFHAEVREAPRYPVGDGDGAPPTQAQLIDACYRLAVSTMGQRCGDADLAFTALTAQGDSGYEITFDYYLNGAAVSLPGGGSAARFRVTQGQITDFWLRFRRYDATGETGLLLPEAQAVAAMGALSDRGGTLTRRYRDGSGDGPISAAWALTE